MNPVTHSDVPEHKGCNPGVKHPCVMYCEAQLTALVEKALANIKSAVCRECSGSGEIGLADGEVPCPKCFGSGDPTKPGVFRRAAK